MNIIAIITGNTRRLLNLTSSIEEYRIENFCKKCRNAKDDNGVYTGVCELKKGGCGCPIESKARQNIEPCPLGFWANDWFKEEEFRVYNS